MAVAPTQDIYHYSGLDSENTSGTDPPNATFIFHSSLVYVLWYFPELSMQFDFVMLIFEIMIFEFCT